jgi:hypothetical protein
VLGNDEPEAAILGFECNRLPMIIKISTQSDHRGEASARLRAREEKFE